MGYQPVKWIELATMVVSAHYHLKYESLLLTTDPVIMGVVRRYTACMMRIIGGFTGDLVSCGVYIKGFAGMITTGVNIGAMIWPLKDDEEATHLCTITDLLYISAGNVSFFNPHDWSNTQKVSQY
jgi:hypothetical protein